MADAKTVEILLFDRTGSWGPFSITSECGECALTRDIIKHTLTQELKNLPICFVEKNWLEHWWQPLKQGGWRTPIVMVDERLISQGQTVNKGLLIQAVIDAYSKKNPIQGSHIFGQPHCQHCIRATQYLDKSNIPYHYHDVITDPHALFEMISRMEAIVGKSHPISLPQIWIDGEYIGTATKLSTILKHQIKPNPQRGQCSLSIKPPLSWPHA